MPTWYVANEVFFLVMHRNRKNRLLGQPKSLPSADPPPLGARAYAVSPYIAVFAGLFLVIFVNYSPIKNRTAKQSHHPPKLNPQKPRQILRLPDWQDQSAGMLDFLQPYGKGKHYLQCDLDHALAFRQTNYHGVESERDHIEQYTRAKRYWAAMRRATEALAAAVVCTKHPFHLCDYFAVIQGRYKFWLHGPTLLHWFGV
jgi:hypothetical protein